MWNQCRAVVLQQLKRHATQRSSLYPTRSSLSWLQHCQFASFSSQSDPPQSFGGVTMDQLLSQTLDETIQQVGTRQFPRIQHALSKYFRDLLDKKELVPCRTMLDMFTIGQRTRQPTMMLDTFRYMLLHYPHEIDYRMYGEVYRILSKQRAGKKMMAIYDLGCQQFAPAVPEVIYRFGIAGQVELHDMDAVIAILDDMKATGIEPTNEMYSRVIQGYGRQGNHAKVMEWFQQVDPDHGQWHVSAVDRIILALGVVEEPELAFEFYVQSNMELNGGTLITLLSVCRHNQCYQQACDILANRKRYELKLDIRGYNAILETLEFLNQREPDIYDTLQEITEKGIGFDPKTKMIVAKNQDVLKGTYFDQVIALQRSRFATHGEIKEITDHPVLPKRNKRTPYSARPYILRLLEHHKLPQAVSLANEYVRPLEVHDFPVEQQQEKAHLIESNRTLRVPSIIASEVIRTYLAARKDDKIDGLLHGYELLGSNVRVGHALLDIMVQYTNGKIHRNHSFAYRAAKIMQVQQVPIFRMILALSLFQEFNDPDAALLLCQQAIDECTGRFNLALVRTIPSSKHHHEGPRLRHPSRRVLRIDDLEQTQDVLGLEEMDLQDENKTPTRNRPTQTQLTHVVNGTVGILANHHRLDDALDIISKGLDAGLSRSPFIFVSLFSAMRTHCPYQSKVKGIVSLLPDYAKTMPFYYTADDVERVLEMMIEDYQIPVTRAILGNITLPLSGGDKSHRLRLLECFEMMEETEVLATDSGTKPFVLPVMVYSMLLQTAYREQEYELFQRIYEDGVRVLREETHHPSLGQRKKQRGSKVLVPLDWEVVRIFTLVQSQAVEEAYEVLMNMHENVGRLSYEAVIKVFRGLASVSTRPDGTKELSPERNELLMNVVGLMEELGFQIMFYDAYDIVHLAKEAKLPELAIEILRLYEKTKKNSEQSRTDQYAAKKMRTIYRTALKMCEEEGQWKLGLRLNDKVVGMLQAEIKEGKRFSDCLEKK